MRLLTLSLLLPLALSLSVSVEKNEAATDLSAQAAARVQKMVPDMEKITEKLYNEIADLEGMETDENVPADMKKTVKQMKEMNAKVVQSFQEMRVKVEKMPKVKAALEKVNLAKEHAKPASGLLQVSTESEASGALLHASGAAAAIARTALERVERGDSREEGDSMASSFLQLSVEDQEAEGKRQAEQLMAAMIERDQEASDAKTQLEELAMKMEMRVGRAMQKSARIDALVDAAIMDYLENPQPIEEAAPTSSLLEVQPKAVEGETAEKVPEGKHLNITSAYTLTDFIYNLFGQQEQGTEEEEGLIKVRSFTDHPFVRSRKLVNTYASTLPSEKAQHMLLDDLLWRLNADSKVAVVHINLADMEDMRIKMQLLCIKDALQQLQASEPMLQSFVKLSGGSKQKQKRMLETAEVELPGIMELDGDDEAVNYFMALADVLYRVGNPPPQTSTSTAAFAVQSAHLVQADPQKASDKMCTFDSKDMSETMKHAQKHFSKLNRLMAKLAEEDLKPKPAPSFVEQASSSSKVEAATKKALKDTPSASFDLANGFGSMTLSKNTQKHQKAVFGGRGEAEAGDSEESLMSRRASWAQGNGMPHGKRLM